MNQARLDNYSELIIWCVGGVEGQRVDISGETIHRDLAVSVAEHAYKAGADLVTVSYEEPALTAARIAHSSEPSLTVFPDYLNAKVSETASDGWARVRIGGQLEPEILSQLDPDRIGRYMTAYRQILRPLRDRVTRFELPWVGVLMPTPALARKAFPDSDPGRALRQYEEAITAILHLDSDPVAFWQQEFAALIRRQDRLNTLGLDALRFSGPGTDLEVGLHTGGRFMAAEETLPSGRTVRVNMPSCEVFTTPDARRTSGRVQTTRSFQPSSAPGQTVEGAWFRFDGGAVVDYGAKKGKPILQRLLAMDAQARYLGEVALVDVRSPVAQHGITFGHMLYDENAACHIALGSGFPRLVPGTERLGKEELVARGVNQSLAHDDMMIGGNEVDVTGLTAEGNEVPIIREGCFVD
jgi:aminopeptidase